MQVTGSRFTSLKMTSQGEELQNASENVEVTFTGVYTILKLDEDGEVSAFKLDVESFYGRSEGITLPIASKGDVVKIAKKGKEGSFTLNGKPFPGETRHLVKIIFDAPHDGASEADLLGATGRKRVGDKWPINMELAKDGLLSHLDATFDPANAKGTVELKKVNKVNEVEGLVLEMSIECNGVKGLVPVAKGFKVDKSKLTHSQTDCYPSNTRLESLSSNMTGSFTFIGSGKLGPKASDAPNGTMEVIMTMKQNITKSPRF